MKKKTGQKEEEGKTKNNDGSSTALRNKARKGKLSELVTMTIENCGYDIFKFLTSREKNNLKAGKYIWVRKSGKDE